MLSRQRKEPGKNYCINAIFLFLLTAACITLAFGMNNVGLFSAKSILISDMRSHYINFFIYLRKEGWTFFTWNMGMGMGYIGTAMYYIFSPFTLLIFLFPVEQIQTAIFLIFLFKAAAASVTMYVLLRRIDPEEPAAVPFAFAYGMLSYYFYFCFNLQFQDGVWLLPLVILGAIKMLDDHRSTLLIISLCGIFLTNFYIAYMVGIFTALFTIYYGVRKGSRILEILRSLGRLVFHALIAALLSAALLLPTILSFINSDTGTNFSYSGPVNYGADELIFKLFIGRFESIGSAAAPALFCGTLGVLLVCFFPFVKGIKPREKIAGLTLLVFMLVSTYWTRLDWIWHGFAAPNAFPYRYVFAISFLILFISFCAWRAWDSAPKWLPAIAIAMAAATVLYWNDWEKRLAPISIISTGIALLIYAFLLFIKSKNIFQKKTFAVLLTVLFCVELTFNGTILVGRNNIQNAFPYKEEFIDYTKQMQLLLTPANNDNPYDFYRVGDARNYVGSEGLALGYHAVSSTSSSYLPAVQHLFAKIGYFTSEKIYEYRSGSQFIDSIFAVRYVVSNEYVDYLQFSGNGLYYNDRALPLGFAVNESLAELQLSDNIQQNIVAIQEHMAYFPYTGESELIDGLARHPLILTELRKNGLSGTIDVPDSCMLYTSIPMDKGWTIYVDGVKTEAALLLDALVGIELEPGRHVVDMRFSPPGLGAGCAISAMTLTGWVAAAILKKRREPRLS